MEVLAERIRRIDELAKQFAKTNRKANGYSDWLRSEYAMREIAIFSEAMEGNVADILTDSGMRGLARLTQSMCVREISSGNKQVVRTKAVRALRNYLAKEYDLNKLPTQGALPRAEANLLCSLFDEGGPFVLDADGHTWVYKNRLRYGLMRQANGKVGGREQHRIAHVLQHTLANPTKVDHSVFAIPPSQVYEALDEVWIARNTPLVIIGHTVPPNYPFDIYRYMHPGVGVVAGEDFIWLVLDAGAADVITAYPVTAIRVP